MGILIKGMEMPKSCNTCELAALVDISDGLAYGCRALKEMIYNDRERLTNCPLVPVPPHGRLIDADAINHEDEIWKKKCIPPQVVYNAWVVAGEMPTVIPADKDGET